MEETYLEDTCWQITFSFLSFVLSLSLSRSQSSTREIEEEAAEIATRRRKKGSSVKDDPNQSSNPSSLPPPSPINAGESVVAGTTGKAKKKAGGARDLRILGPVLWSAQSSNCEIHIFSPNHVLTKLEPWRDLKDKVVLVTGASSGIGKEICLDLVKAGCKIIAAARRVDRLNSLCSNINSFGSTGTQATALELDVASDVATIRKAVLVLPLSKPVILETSLAVVLLHFIQAVLHVVQFIACTLHVWQASLNSLYPLLSGSRG
uniref:3-oxoacyl-[acyl-carrier-protein] reductase n=1 Tax=Brassica oleracea var. oleracea TaxID=109376 RepID=A0A0D3CD71_BRAOL